MPEEITERLQWLLHFAEHGSASLTCAHFGISRNTFYRWLNRFDPEDLGSLTDHPTRPITEHISRVPEFPIPSNPNPNPNPNPHSSCPLCRLTHWLRAPSLRSVCTLVLVTVILNIALLLLVIPVQAGAASTWNPTLLVNTEAFQTIDDVDTGANVVLKFGETLQESLTYNRGASQFEFTRSLKVAGNLTATGSLSIKNVMSGSALRVDTNADVWGNLAVSGTTILDGNVGIGTTTPETALEVVGTISGAQLNVTGTGSFSDIVIPSRSLGTPTYSSVSDYMDSFGSAGRKTGGTISDAGSSTIAITGGTGFIKATDDDNAQLLFFDFPAPANIAIPSNSTRYIGVEYNGGSPRVVARTEWNWDLDSEFPLGRVINDSINGADELYISNSPWWVTDGMTNVIEVIRSFGLVRRDQSVGGLMISVTGTRNLAITAGRVWNNLNEFEVPAQDTSSSGTVEYYWYKAGTGWQESDVTQYSVTQWNDVAQTSLQTFDNNKFGNVWVYGELDNGVPQIALLYPQAQYNTAAEAEATHAPSNVPTHISEVGMLLGRIIIQKGVNTPVKVESAFGTTFSASVTTDHGNLSGLSDDDHTQYLLLSGRTGGQHISDTIEITGTASGRILSFGTRLTGSGNVSIRTLTDSTTAFQVLDNDGGNPVFNIDTTNERVGIGTASPTNTLDVSLNNSTAVTAANIQTNSVGGVYISNDLNAGGTTQGSVLMFDNVAGRSRAAIAGFHSGTNLDTSALSFFTHGATEDIQERMRIDYNGNVGIGTTTPGSKLSVSGTMSGKSLQITGTGAAPIIFTDTKTGRVGIGTTSPGSPLTVNSSTRNVIDIQGGAASDWWHGYYLEGKAAMTAGDSSWLRLNQAGNFTAGVYMPLGTLAVDKGLVVGDASTTITPPTDGMIVKGNVGIGSESPETKLEVTGTASGDLLHAQKDLSSSGTLAIEGNAAFGGTIKLNGINYTFPAADGSASGKVLKTNAAGQLSWSTDNDTGASGLTAPTAEGMFVNQGGDTMTGALTIKKNSGTATGNTLVVDTNGLVYDATNKRVGIGTASPGAKLELNSANSDTANFMLGKGAGSRYNIWRDDTNGPLNFYGEQSGYSGYVFGTVDGERMRIATDGNVGIGSDGPLGKLAVQNATTPSKLLLHVVGTEASGDAAGIWFKSAVEYTDHYQKGAVVFVNDGTNYGRGDLQFLLNNTTSDANVAVNTDTKMILKNSGNLGIGTTAPETKLEVTGTTSGNFIFGQQGMGASGAVVIKKRAGTATGNTLVVDTNGLVYDATNKRVGIGTAAPGALLNTNGNIRASRPAYGADQYLAMETENGAELKLKGFSASDNQKHMMIDNVISTGGGILPGSENYMAFRLGVAGAESTKMLIDYQGNVGIGTTSPATKLDVAGGMSGTALKITGTANLATTSGNVGIGTTSPQTDLEIAGKWNGNGATSNLRLQGLGSDPYYYTTLSSTYTNPSVLTLKQVSAGAEHTMMTVTDNVSTVFNSGNVGIGTTAPETKLEVIGTISGSALAVSGLTSGRLPYVTTNGQLTDSQYLLADGNNLLLKGTNKGLYFGAGNEAYMFFDGAKFYVNSSTINLDGKLKSTATAWTGAVGGGPAQNSTQVISTNAAGVDVGPQWLFGGETGNGTTPYGFAVIKAAKASATAGDYSGYLDFYTVASDSNVNHVMRMDGAGKVGIGTGTTNPISKFQIVSTNTAPSLSANSGIVNFGVAASNNLSIGTYADSPWGVWLQAKDNNNSNSSYPLVFNPLGGNVGIGTTAPETKLEVTGSASGNFIFGQQGLGASGAVVIKPKPGTATGNTLVVDTNGLVYDATNKRIGIGTSAPQFRMHVVDPSNATVGIQRASTTTGDTAQLLFGVTTAVNGTSQMGGMMFERTGATGIGSLHLLNHSDADSASATKTDAKLTIASNGNVGIGATAPETKLEVTGTASGNFIFGQQGLGASGAVVIKKRAGTATGNTLVVDTNGLVYDATNKRVGIGTASPDEKLTINSGDALIENGNVISPFGGIGQYQNLLTYSETFNNAAWNTNGGGTEVLANQATAPDGTTTADLARDNAGSPNSVWMFLDVTSTTSAATQYTYSVWMKSVSGASDTVLMTIYDEISGAQGGYKTIDGTWRRYSVTATYTAGSTIRWLGFGNAGGGAFSSNGAYLWGAQLEAGSSVNTYARTTTAALSTVGRGLIAPSLLVSGTGASTAPLIYTDSTTGRVGIGTSTPGTAALAVMNGNMGVGTTAPMSLFHIEKNQNAGTELSIRNTNAGTAAYGGLYMYGGGTSGGLYAINGTYSTTEIADKFLLKSQADAAALMLEAGATDGQLQFYTGGEAAGNRRMTIDSAGNVGIGATVPETKLEVTGTMSGAALQANNINGSASAATGSIMIGQAAGAPVWKAPTSAMVWYIDGAVATGTKQSATVVMPYGFTCTDVDMRVDTAPVGSSLIVDINKDGTTIFSTRPEIDASGTTEDGNHAFSVTDLPTGSVITLDVDQVGSGTAGSDLTVILKGTRKY